VLGTGSDWSVDLIWGRLEFTKKNTDLRGNTMFRTHFFSFVIVLAGLPGLASADQLTAIIQQDLAALGYEPGNLDGEVTTQTVIAVSKFQAEHDLEVTGEVTPQLAGVIKAAISQQGQTSSSAPAVAAAPGAPNPAALQAAQQACLQQKVADAQQKQTRSRGLRSLARAVSRIGGNDVAEVLADVQGDIYDINLTREDLASAAKDLGLSEAEVEACRNPQ
jgi:hypothetical protein